MALQLPSEIKTLLEEICTTFGATLIDSVLRGTKELMMLELYIDTPEGITLDICEKINRRLLEVSETNEFINAIRSIEVSSPGAERSLQYHWQYPRNIGRILEITYAQGDTQNTGLFTLVEANSEFCSVKEKNKSKRKSSENEDTILTIPYNKIQKAIVVLLM